MIPAAGGVEDKMALAGMSIAATRIGRGYVEPLACLGNLVLEEVDVWAAEVEDQRVLVALEANELVVEGEDQGVLVVVALVLEGVSRP